MSHRSVVLGVIPARADSTRFPLKILAPILGKPLIQWVWEHARESKALSELVVATDDERIQKTVESFGGTALMTPKDTPSGTDRVAFIAKDQKADIVVNIQGDEPLLPPAAIDKLVQAFQTFPTTQMATLSVSLTDAEALRNKNVVKVVTDCAGNALYFSREALKVAAPSAFLKHVGIYAYRRDTLLNFCKLPVGKLEKSERLEQLRALENGIPIRVVEIDSDTVAIDAPEDVAVVEARLKHWPA